MANGIWIGASELLSPGATQRLQTCVARGLFNIYVGVGYPSPAQGLVTFPALSGFVPDSMAGIQVTQSQVQQMVNLAAGIDPRLKIWAWLGTFSTNIYQTPPPPDNNLSGVDAIGHYWAKISVNTPAKRAAIINACMEVVNWGFYGVQDDTEDFQDDSLEPSRQHGTIVNTFKNEFAMAAHASGKKYHAYLPAIWFTYNNTFLSQITEADAIILVNGVDDPGQAFWHSQITSFMNNSNGLPVLYNIGWPDTDNWLIAYLNSHPNSASYKANRIVGYVLYDYDQHSRDGFGPWNAQRAAFPVAQEWESGSAPPVDPEPVPVTPIRLPSGTPAYFNKLTTGANTYATMAASTPTPGTASRPRRSRVKESTMNIKQSESTAARRTISFVVSNTSDGSGHTTNLLASELKISKGGGAEANASNGSTHVANGRHTLVLTAGEIDTIGELSIRIAKTGVYGDVITHQVVAYDPGDAADLGLTNVDATISSRLATVAYEAPSALLTTTDGVETNWTVRDALRVMLSVLAGKVSGAGTGTEVFRSVTDTDNRVTATVDTSGNRTSVTYDKT